MHVCPRSRALIVRSDPALEPVQDEISPPPAPPVYSVPAGGEVSLLRDVGPVSYAVFSSDGERIETLGNDGAARIWDIDTGLSAVVAHVPWAGEAVMAISPDGRTLASANWDRVAIVRCSVCSGLDELVQLANETVPRELTPREHALFVDAG